MKRDQTLHERLIPLLVEGIGAQTYLELGAHWGETILKVNCPIRIGVDSKESVPWPWPDGLSIYGMTTQEFLRDTARFHAPYDFVFIDADHSQDAVRDDFFGIWPFVSDEGLVVLHDTNPETVSDTAPGLCGDSWGFAWDLTNRDDGDTQYECVTLPYHPGLTIIRKRVKWGPE